jgi:hypothetical protein
VTDGGDEFARGVDVADEAEGGFVAADEVGREAAGDNDAVEIRRGLRRRIFDLMG